ncbi:unnamed protein product, partial [Amoebophrya sp. A25]
AILALRATFTETAKHDWSNAARTRRRLFMRHAMGKKVQFGLCLDELYTCLSPICVIFEEINTLLTQLYEEYTSTSLRPRGTATTRETRPSVGAGEQQAEEKTKRTLKEKLARQFLTE